MEHEPISWGSRVCEKIKSLVEVLLEHRHEESHDFSEKLEGCLKALEGIKVMAPKVSSTKGSSIGIPSEFRCPLSNRIMTDPVVIRTGYTYDRISIKTWLKEKKFCPKSREKMVVVEEKPLFFENLLIRNKIRAWCDANGLQNEGPADYDHTYDELSEPEKSNLEALLEVLADWKLEAEDRARAVDKLKVLTQFKLSHRVALGTSASHLRILIFALMQKVQTDMEEEMLAILLNIAGEPGCRGQMAEAENKALLTILVRMMKPDKSDETRTRAVSILNLLSRNQSSRKLIGEAGVLDDLVDAVRRNDGQVWREAARCMAELCDRDDMFTNDNPTKLVECGGLEVISVNMLDREMRSEMMYLLEQVTRDEVPVVTWVTSWGGVGRLVAIIKVEKLSSAEKESCLGCIRNICVAHLESWALMRKDDEFVGLVSDMINWGTRGVKLKALSVMNLINWRRTRHGSFS